MNLRDLDQLIHTAHILRLYTCNQEFDTKEQLKQVNWSD